MNGKNTRFPAGKAHTYLKQKNVRKVKSSNASDTETVMYVIGWILNALLLGGRYGGKFIHLIQKKTKNCDVKQDSFWKVLDSLKGD